MLSCYIKLFHKEFAVHCILFDLIFRASVALFLHVIRNHVNIFWSSLGTTQSAMSP